MHLSMGCLLYTSDAADEEDSVDLGGSSIIKKKKEEDIEKQKKKNDKQRSRKYDRMGEVINERSEDEAYYTI